MNISGHAIEVRVYAEDATNNFSPDIGTLTTYKRPGGIGVRVDDGFEEGMEIPIYYDPMISKLITFGNDRKESIKRMIRAITDYEIAGIQTTLPFGKFVMEHEAFISGNFDTHFVGKYFKPSLLKATSDDEKMIGAWYASKLFSQKQQNNISHDRFEKSKWKQNRR